jgi:ribosome biogenesis GTPase / thiamine phosphate phosphatase
VSTELKGVVVARHRRHASVESGGLVRSCLIRNRKLQPLVGDGVLVSVADDGTHVIEAVLPRDRTLTRIDRHGQREAVAANVSELLVVAAPAPAPDWFLVDRYLAAAELIDAKAAVVFNKSDLVVSEPSMLGCYRNVGYPVFTTSARLRIGLAELRAQMRGERSVMVGQSGVGKSSLLNALVGSEHQAVAALSDSGRHGRHTTTSTILYRLDNGGELIDSPGVRNYSPFIEHTADVARGFREFRPLLGDCRFDDCRHIAEPGCAVKDAVDERRIDPRRYESYRKLRSLVDELRK